MIASRLKMLVQQVLADATTRAAFLTDPEKVLAAYAVSTSEERRALLRLHARLATAKGADDASLGALFPWP